VSSEIPRGLLGQPQVILDLAQGSFFQHDGT
jgi:hypothetical protein